jgi:hypothetical protein
MAGVRNQKAMNGISGGLLIPLLLLLRPFKAEGETRQPTLYPGKRKVLMPVTIEMPVLESAVLQGNPLGDPVARRVPVILPPDYADSKQRYPVLVALANYP